MQCIPTRMQPPCLPPCCPPPQCTHAGRLPPPHCPLRCYLASSARAASRRPARHGLTRSAPSRRRAAAPPRAACARSAAVCVRPRRRMHPPPPLRQPPSPPLRQPLWPSPRRPPQRLPPRRPRHSPRTLHRVPPPCRQRRRSRQRWLRLSARRLPHGSAALRAARCSGQNSCWRPLPAGPQAGPRAHDARIMCECVGSLKVRVSVCDAEGEGAKAIHTVRFTVALVRSPV